ncbi:hypothetical protein ACQ4PT_003232 [Festuca glaucescens]
MAARTLASNTNIGYDNTTATAILEYTDAPPAARAGRPDFPNLPAFNDLNASAGYTAQLRSLGSKAHPVDVPTDVDEHMLITIAVNVVPCATGNATCEGPRGNRLAASLNNVTLLSPPYRRHPRRLLRLRPRRVRDGLPRHATLRLQLLTDDNVPVERWFTKRGTKVKVLEYGAVVEVVFQDTAILGAENHPMHLHSFAFYVVGMGLGNFNQTKDPATYNLIDPPFQNTVTVPKSGWAAIRFRAANPGVWFMHCHFERHSEWGMDTVFIVKDGKTPEAKMMRRPPGMPRC